MAKKTAFVFGRPALNSAKLQYMPFALSALKKLAENEATQIDVYLTQSQTDAYKSLLPKNVNLFFLDKKFLWSQGSGSKLYFLLAFYFWWITLFKKYDDVWSAGQTGIVLGGVLAKRKGLKHTCLNDEFPSISYLKIWIEKEKKYLAAAAVVILPDESRIDVLKTQVAFKPATAFYTLPNIPLTHDIAALSQTDWRKQLSLAPQAKLVMYAGGIDRENNIDFLLTVFPFTPPEFILVMVGNGVKYKNNDLFKHERIVWIEKPLSDDELHTLIAQSTCCICYYASFALLEYVGKSSGKIMRSLLLGTPVISSDFVSLKFIEQDGMGELITAPHQLIDALIRIDKDQQLYKENIKKHLHKYTFENYWNMFRPAHEKKQVA